ncbi:MAG: hypothetical protein GEV28_14830 [Actinophytocola sp.]|nr:hypothetical protein [Actinophytocola sp.]
MVAEHRTAAARGANRNGNDQERTLDVRRAGVGLDLAALPWVVATYALPAAGFTLLFGRIADLPSPGRPPLWPRWRRPALSG